MKCPNCGQEFEGPMCPNCGQARRSVIGKVLAVILAILIFLPAAFVGGCSIVVFASSRIRPGEGAPILLAIGLIAIGVAAAVGWAVVSLWRS